MEKELPTYTIKGTVFLVDVFKSDLIQVDKPDNIISFNDMQDQTSHYSFVYDTLTCNLAKSPQANDFPDPDYDSLHLRTTNELFVLDENHVIVEIPQMSMLDPERMAARCKIPIEALKGKSDFELLVDQDLLKMRLYDEFIPRIKIAEDHFFVKPSTGFLHSFDFPDTELVNMASLYKTTNGQNQGLYDLESGGFIIPRTMLMDGESLDIFMLFLNGSPEHIVAYELPSLIQLDPVQTALSFGLDVKSVLRRYPIIQEYNAKIMPVRESEIPKIIEKNVQKNISEWAKKEIVVQKQKSRKQYRRGLH